MKNRIQKISAYRPSIFQGKLEFAAVRNGLADRGFTLTTEHAAERGIARALLFTLTVLALLYLYFIGSSILNVIARREAVAERDRLASAVSLLEREYFAEAGSIRPEDGKTYGLAPLSSTVYVYRPGNLTTADGRPAIPSNDI